MNLFSAAKPEPKDYIVRFSLIYLNMRKIPDEKIDKLRTNEDNQ
jgi:hypothetical protein